MDKAEMQDKVCTILADQLRWTRQGDARGAVLRGPQRRLARPVEAVLALEEEFGRLDPRGRDGGRQDRRPGRRPGGVEGGLSSARLTERCMGTPTRRVVVTGIGPVTPVGIGVDAFWSAPHRRAGAASRRIENFDPTGLPVQIAGEVHGLRARDVHGPQGGEARRPRARTSPSPAARLAWEDAGEPQVDPARTGGHVLDRHRRAREPAQAARDVPGEGARTGSARSWCPQLMPNASAGHVAMAFGFTGPNTCITTACAAGGHAVGEGVPDGSATGWPTSCIAGGTEASVLPLTLSAFAQMQALTRNPDPETASRPFDKERDGFVLSEGACALVLEEAERAAGPRRDDLRRDRRLRRHRRRAPHHRARAGGARAPWAPWRRRCEDAGESPDGRRLHQRARDVDRS